jgi:hypothetical protein
VVALAATWPDGLDVDRVGWLAVAGIVVAAVVAALVVRAAVPLQARVAALAPAGLVVVSLTAYRDELDECRARCDCSLLGRRIPVPECDEPPPVAPPPVATTVPPA